MLILPLLVLASLSDALVNKLCRRFRTAHDAIKGPDPYKQVFASSPADPCARLSQRLATKAPLTHRDVKDCYLHFPFNRNIKTTTLASVSCLMPMYVFIKYSMSPAGLSQQTPYNVTDALLKTDAMAFNTDFSLQMHLRRLLVPVNDGHLDYYPHCYRQFEFRQPFYVFPVYNPKTQAQEFVLRVLVHRLATFPGLDRARVLSINGHDPYTAVKAFATTDYGKCKEVATRVAKCFSSWYFSVANSGFALEKGAFFQRKELPAETAITYELLLTNGQRKTVTVPWMVKPLYPNLKFTNARRYWDMNCAAKPVKVIQPPKAPPAYPPRAKLVLKNPPKPVVPAPVPITPPVRKQRIFADSNEGILRKQSQLLLGPGFAFYALDKRKHVKVAVLVVGSLDVKNSTLWDIKMAEGFQLLAKNGYTHLLLDVTNNGGGSICLSKKLAALLDPEPNAPFPTERKPYRSVARLSKFSEALTTTCSVAKERTSPFRQSRFVDPATFKNYRGDAWKKVARTRLTGAGTSLFSVPLFDPCYAVKPTNPLLKIKNHIPLKNMALISNGFCASACATLTAHLMEVSNIPTFVTTTIPFKHEQDNEDRSIPAPFAFAGGQVYSSNDLWKLMAKTRFDTAKVKEAPPFMPTTANLRFTLRQTFSITVPKCPLEYWRRRADYIVRITEDLVQKPALRWKAAAGLLGWRLCKQDCENSKEDPKHRSNELKKQTKQWQKFLEHEQKAEAQLAANTARK